MLFSVLLFLLLGVGAVPSARWESDPSDNLPSGFVTTKGSQFWLDHYPYYFNGANAYWLPQMVHDEQFEQVYQELQTIGVKVIRTWAFSMLDDALPTTNLTYYQVSTVNRPRLRTSTGKMGLACRRSSGRRRLPQPQLWAVGTATPGQDRRVC